MTQTHLKTTAAVIVAAGRGTRAGGEIAKQWQEVAGARVIDHTLRTFRTHPRIDHIVVVLHPDSLNTPLSGATTVAGGDTRARSVRAGLEALTGAAPDLVLIHDVARPCLPSAVIDRVLEALNTTPGAAPALAVTDALWHGDNGKVTGTQDRTGLYRAQTPQGFHFDAILAAHRAGDGTEADDVAVARAAGLDVTIVAGSEDNLKITHAADFDRVAQILETRNGHSTG